MKWILVITALLVISACSLKREPVDLIVHNATIYTLNENNDVFRAMAIKDGKIIEVGADRAILNKYRSESIKDAKKRYIYPGFIDGHCHFLGFGRTLEEIDLRGLTSWKETLDLLADKKYDPGSWIIGRGWDQNDWTEPIFPNRTKLDSLFPKNPVILTRVDGHTAIVNEVVLDLFDITSKTEIDGGQIILEDGIPSGVLIDNAMTMVKERMLKASSSKNKKALLNAQRACFEVGLTTVSDAGLLYQEIKQIDSLQQVGELKMRVYAMAEDAKENFDHFLEKGPIETDRLTVRSFKFYADGSLGSRSACLMKPYSDEKENNGFLLNSPEYFRMRAKQLFNAGFQMNTHCIGDSANRMMLNIYGETIPQGNDLRWRIEHAQVVAKQDRQMFRTFNVIPSIQPTHATSDMYWAELRLGKSRVRRAYAYKSLKEQLGIVTLGTDFPVEEINPLHTFYAAVVRKDHNGYPANGFIKEESLTREDAIRGMTIWAALANFEEGKKGSLEPGKFADFVVLDRDLLEIKEDEILETKVLYTYIDGEKVFVRSLNKE